MDVQWIVLSQFLTFHNVAFTEHKILDFYIRLEKHNKKLLHSAFPPLELYLTRVTIICMTYGD